jgi:hypothetical protein
MFYTHTKQQVKLQNIFFTVETHNLLWREMCIFITLIPFDYFRNYDSIIRKVINIKL